MIYLAISKILDVLGRSIRSLEEDERERFLGQATSHADLEIRQREWDRRQAENKALGARFF